MLNLVSSGRPRNTGNDRLRGNCSVLVKHTNLRSLRHGVGRTRVGLDEWDSIIHCGRPYTSLIQASSVEGTCQNRVGYSVHIVINALRGPHPVHRFDLHTAVSLPGRLQYTVCRSCGTSNDSVELLTTNLKPPQRVIGDATTPCT
jgi:hypothetical protein